MALLDMYIGRFILNWCISNSQSLKYGVINYLSVTLFSMPEMPETMKIKTMWFIPRLLYCGWSGYIGTCIIV